MIKAPFPWFGGKSTVAAEVWQRFGSVQNYVEPFFGSGAVLFSRPQPFTGVETINDKDRFVANAWRALQAAPDAIAEWADWPVNEVDLEARHYWLITEGAQRLENLSDPTWFDAQVAGWWIWGICSWIGSGWCSGEGPWRLEGEKWTDGDAGRGINRQLPHLGNAGRGINRQRSEHLSEWFGQIAARLRRVRVCCGDWQRVCGDSVTIKHGLTAVFLDPPYSAEADRAELYATEDFSVAHDVREWAIERGDNTLYRIALCGYEGEHAMPKNWTELAWKARGGFGSQGEGRGRDNAGRERIWFSPHCLGAKQGRLF